MAKPLLLCDTNIWKMYESCLHDAGCEQFLNLVSKEGTQRIISVQLRHTNGNIDLSITNTIQAIKQIERATEELHEHERLMDKDYFEYLLKSNLHMTSGKDKDHGRPITWLREGLKAKELWKLQYGTPKAHAYIRYQIYLSQVARVRLLAEKEFSPTMGAAGLVVVDMVFPRSLLSRSFGLEGFRKRVFSPVITTVTMAVAIALNLTCCPLHHHGSRLSYLFPCSATTVRRKFL